jgi:hypothetical protein
VPEKRRYRKLTFPASNAAAVHSEGVYPIEPTVVSEALIGSWTA